MPMVPNDMKIPESLFSSWLTIPCNETEANILEDIQVLVYETLQMHVELLKVKTGCLELTFQIPDREVHLSQDQKSTLSREGVFFLAIDGEVYLEVYTNAHTFMY